MQKFIIPVLVIIVLLVAGYFGITYWNAQQKLQEIGQYQTSVVGYGNLTASVGATGVVKPYQSSVIAWETSGTVQSVNVSVGDTIETGQELALLDPTTLSQGVILAQADLANAQKALEDLQNTQSTQFKALQAVRSAEKTILEAERALDLFDEQDYKDDVDKAREDVITTEDDLKTAKEDFEPYQDFDPENTKRKDAQKKVDDAQLKYDEAVRTLDLLELEKEQAQVALDLAKAQLADAQREYDRIKDGPDPRDLAAVQARIQAAEAILALPTLKAPFAGTITDVSIMPGDEIAPGTIAFRIDDLSTLTLDVRVTEVDINRITLGQKVNLSFDAILDQPYSGSVTEVASVGTTVQGVVEFIVTVTLSDPDERVKPGMTAAVNIVVDQFDNVLLIPNRAVRLRNGERVVYVLRNNQLSSVNVTLGASSENQSQVTEGGLNAGDTIVLNPPQEFEAGGPPPFANR